MKVVVVGAGISGIVSAIKMNCDDITILEHNDKPLKKLLLTGNGKCNYFNDEWDKNKYFSYDKELIDKLINEENKNKIISFYDSIGLIPRVRNGYYYPASNQAYTVYNALLKEANNHNVKFKYNYDVKDIKYVNNKYVINDEIECDKLVISTGSKAYPKTGSEGFGYKLCSDFNIKVNNIYPSLVGLITNKNLKDISGVRSEVKVSLYEKDNLINSEIGEIQFGDNSLSGICIYNLSIYMNKDNYNIRVNFLNDFNIRKDNFISYYKELDGRLNNRNITDLLECHLNYKLVNYILKISKIDSNKKYSDLNDKELNILMNNLLEYRFDIIANKGYDSSQVCSGGVSLKEVNLDNLESVKYKNLYFTGEVLDLTGICGGYNISFAVLSGLLVGEHIND